MIDHFCAVTFREWAQDYFANKIDPTRKAGGLDRERRSYKPLEAFFGDMLLTDIKRSVIMQYRNKRLQEPIVRRAKVVTVDGTPRKPTFLTINRELALLRSLLNLAEEDEIIEAAPRFHELRPSGGRVFTRNGRPMKSIRTAFEEAREVAGIEDLRLHDFRHTAVTRWALMRIPQAAVMAAAGHHSIPQNLAYTNLQPDDVNNTFKLATQVQQGKALETASNASY